MNNSILTNTTALYVNRNLSNAQKSISASLERMSSGFKINSAKDNAANCIISRKMENRLSGLDVAMKNLQHANSLLEVADSALDNMMKKLNKIRELTLQTLNGTCGTVEKQAIQNEIQELVKEVYREKQTTKFNNVQIFNSGIKESDTGIAIDPSKVEKPIKPYAYKVEYLESTGTQYIDTGYTPNENTEIYATAAFMKKSADLQQMGCITNDGGKYARWHFGVYQNKLTCFKTQQGSTGDVAKEYDSEFHDYYLSNDTAGIDDTTKKVTDAKNSNVSFTLFARNGYVDLNGKPKIGYYSKAKLSSFQIYENSELIHNFTPVVTHEGKGAMYDEVTGRMYEAQGGDLLVGNKVEEEEIKPNKINFQVGADAGKNNTISAELGFNLNNFDCNILNEIDAKQSLYKIDALMGVLLGKRSSVGAIMNRVDSVSKIQATDVENLKMSNSLIKDTDIAFEATKLIKSQIFQQVSTSLFSQANTFNGNLALRLLGV